MVSTKALIDEQRKFFKTGATRCLEFRKNQLRKLRQAIVDNAEGIQQCIYKDLRRAPAVSKAFEVDGCLECIDHYLANIDQWAKPQKLAQHQAGQPEIIYEPKGVILVITAWNYPIYLGIIPAAEAIAAGNTVIIKPSEVSPHSSKMLKKIVEENFDKKFLAVVEGAVDVTQDLLRQRFDHIFYTGNSEVGKVVMRAASEFLTPVTLELGGKCPTVVESDADLEKCAQRISDGKWLNSGQTCIAPDYVLTTEAMKPKLVAALQNVITTTYGDNVQKSPHFSRMVNQRHFDRVKALMDKTNGKVLFKGGEADRNDVFIPPTLVETKLDDALMKEEVFGPILPIITVKDLDEAIGVINDGEKPLAAYLFSKDQKKVDKFLSETTSGGVTINDTLKHSGVLDLPFGGVGSSGMGAYRGKPGFIEMSHAKAVLISNN